MKDERSREELLTLCAVMFQFIEHMRLAFPVGYMEVVIQAMTESMERTMYEVDTDEKARMEKAIRVLRFAPRAVNRGQFGFVAIPVEQFVHVVLGSLFFTDESEDTPHAERAMEILEAALSDPNYKNEATDILAGRIVKMMPYCFPEPETSRQKLAEVLKNTMSDYPGHSDTEH